MDEPSLERGRFVRIFKDGPPDRPLLICSLKEEEKEELLSIWLRCYQKLVVPGQIQKDCHQS